MNSLAPKVILFLILLFSYPSLAQVDTEPTIKHVLLIDWVENPDSLSQAEVYLLFEGLPQKIEGFRSIKFKPIILSNRDFDEIIIMIFDSQVALDAYQEHPDHLRIKKLAKANLVKMTKFDYAD